MFKKLAVITALVAALALPAFAGDGKGKGKGLDAAPGQHKDDPHRQDAKKRFEKLCDDLKLTDDQKKKAQPIWVDTEKKMTALHDDKSLSDDQKKAKMKTIHEEGEKKFRAVLTPDQQKKLDALKEEGKAKAKEHNAKAKTGGDKK